MLPGSSTSMQFVFREEARLIGSPELDDDDDESENDDGSGSSRGDEDGGGKASVSVSVACEPLQVCACLSAEENALTASSASAGGKAMTTAATNMTRRKCRNWFYDPQVTEVNSEMNSLSLTLSLPHSAPASLTTDIVEIAYFCQVEIVVRVITSTTTAKGGKSKEKVVTKTMKNEVLSLSIPCDVVHGVKDDSGRRVYGGGGGDERGKSKRRSLSRSLSIASEEATGCSLEEVESELDIENEAAEALRDREKLTRRLMRM
jgi:hypothetical protein